jgi:molybdate transport system substrate-binding protein
LGVQALLDPAVQKIAIANPQHAPYGRAAESALRSFGVYSAVESRLVYGENIAQAAQFVDSGAADIGVLALSLALAPAMTDNGRYWMVPSEAYPRMEQGCVLLREAQDPVAAQQFQAYVLSLEGQRVLDRFGFQRPGA